MQETIQENLTIVRDELSRLSHDRTGVHIEDALDHVGAFLSGRYYFDNEPWSVFDAEQRFGTDIESLPTELLIRPYAKEEWRGNVLPNLKVALSCIYESDLHVELDAALTLMALDYAQKHRLFPISVNVLGKTACTQRYWDIVEPMLDMFPSSYTTFEILEDPWVGSYDLDVLNERHAQGRRFALDDLDVTLDKCPRVELYGGGVFSYIKVDGPIVRQWCDQGDGDLESIVDSVEYYAPNAVLIMERVRSIDEAGRLSSFVADIMGEDSRFRPVFSQGRVLPLSEEMARDSYLHETESFLSPHQIKNRSKLVYK